MSDLAERLAHEIKIARGVSAGYHDAFRELCDVAEEAELTLRFLIAECPECGCKFNLPPAPTEQPIGGEQ